jgi:hypothetical protein
MRALSLGMTALAAALCLPRPANAQSCACQMSFPVATTIADGDISDGAVGAEWADAALLQSGDACMRQLLDQSPPNTALENRNIKVHSKRDGAFLYLAFEIEDHTRLTSNNSQLLNGDRIIVQIDPFHNGGDQLGNGTANSPFDYRVEVVTFRGQGGDSTFFYNSSKAPTGLCPKQSWLLQSTPNGLVTGISLPDNIHYAVEMKIPLAAIGNPNEEMGIAIAVLNDLGSGGSNNDSTGLSFPPALGVSNTSNPVYQGGDPTGSQCGNWLVPRVWATASFGGPVNNIYISQSPVWYLADSVQARACGTGGATYEYNNANPCKLQVSTTLSNAPAVADKRNLLFMWAHSGPSAVVWKTISIQENALISGASPTVNSDLWGTVAGQLPRGLTNHPCVRAYVLPAAFNPEFDKNAILNISTPDDLAKMETVYGVGGNSCWAQKNITWNTGQPNCTQGCPAAGARPYALPPAIEPPQTAAAPRGNPFVLFAQPPVARPAGLLWSSRDERTFGDGKNAVAQIRAFARAEFNSKVKYNFLEELGGVLHVFPIDRVQREQNVAIEMEIGNPAQVAQTIFVQAETYAPTLPNFHVVLPKEAKYGPREVRTVKAEASLKKASGCFGKSSGSTALILVGLMALGLRVYRRR